MGHGLGSAQLAVVAVAAYRHARRAGRSLPDMCEQIDQVLLQTSGGQAFSTAVLAQLDTVSGALHWINAGHPEPLLIRHGQLIKSLHVVAPTPLGIDLRGSPSCRRSRPSAPRNSNPGTVWCLYRRRHRSAGAGRHVLRRASA